MSFTTKFSGLRTRARRSFAGALAACMTVLCLGATGAAAQPAPLPAGTVTRNAGRGTYVPAGFMEAEIVTSNAVIATVRPVESLMLTEDQAVSRPPGSIATLSHLLKNTGNVESRYSIALGNNGSGCAADTADLGSLRVVHDVNANGVVDGGEPALALNAPNVLQLQPDETAALLIQGTVPGTANGGIRLMRRTSTASMPISAAKRSIARSTAAVASGRPAPR